MCSNEILFTMEKLIKLAFQHDESAIDSAFKWHSNAKSNYGQEFSRKPYEAGDPVWIIRNGSINYIGENFKHLLEIINLVGENVPQSFISWFPSRAIVNKYLY